MASNDDSNFQLYKAIENNDLDKLRELLKAGHDPEAYGVEYGGHLLTKSLLHMACEKDRPKCAEILLEYGASPRLRDKWGMTPLIYSVIGHDLVFMKILLENDPGHVNEPDMKHMTALHLAAEEGSDEMVKLLLSYGANVHLRTSRIGHTPLMEACKRGSVHSENRSEHLKCIRTLIDMGSDLEAADYRYKRTALQVGVLFLFFFFSLNHVIHFFVFKRISRLLCCEILIAPFNGLIQKSNEIKKCFV